MSAAPDPLDLSGVRHPGAAPAMGVFSAGARRILEGNPILSNHNSGRLAMHLVWTRRRPVAGVQPGCADGRNRSAAGAGKPLLLHPYLGHNGLFILILDRSAQP
jgi:hypothetical protein